MAEQKSKLKVIGYNASVAQELANRRLDGVVRYVDEHANELALRDFRYFKPASNDEKSPPPSWTGIADGMILCFGISTDTNADEIGRWVERGGVPSVSLSLDWRYPSIPVVGNDSKAMMNIAADYFVERGFQNFAFMGSTRVPVEVATRHKMFAHRLAKHGFKPLELDISFPTHGGTEDINEILQEKELIEQLKRAPKPLAVYALNDDYAKIFCLLCEHLGLAVPKDVAILGSGNLSNSRCNDPTISTVQTANDLVGYEAARILHEMIKGQQPAENALLIPPLRVIERQSTSGEVPQQNVILEAQEYIRNHACEGIGVQDLLRKLSISRRTFEMQFVEQTGQSPKQMIQQVRLVRAKHLLTQTQLSIVQVAMMTGFSDAAALSNFISKATGKSPSEWREIG